MFLTDNSMIIFVFPLPNVLSCQQLPAQLITVSLSTVDAVLPDIAIKTNKKQ